MISVTLFFFFLFFFNDTATTEIYTLSDTLSLHDALPIYPPYAPGAQFEEFCRRSDGRSEEHTSELQSPLNISYAVFCLKKKKKTKNNNITLTSLKPYSNEKKTNNN